MLANRRTRRFAAIVAASTLSAGAIAAPAASAQPPVFTGGLVNVTIVDFADINLEDIVIQVPVAVAANLCDIDVNALAIDAADGDAECTATATSRANNRP